jgi:hypothetical protein
LRLRAGANPTLSVLSEILRLQGQLDQLGGDDQFSAACRDGVVRTLTDDVLLAIAADPLAAFRKFESEGGSSSDIDGDGFVSAFEIAQALQGTWETLGFFDQAAELREAMSIAIGEIASDGTNSQSGDPASVAWSVSGGEF